MKSGLMLPINYNASGLYFKYDTSRRPREMNRTLYFLLWFFLITPGFSQEISHVEQNLGWVQQATTIDIMNQRIYSAAMEYQIYAPVPRGALFDLALPADSVEYDSLKGNALLLLSCVVQDSLEIPPSRLYLINGNEKFDLAAVMILKSEVPDSSEIILRVFGKYRSDTIYLFPLVLRNPGAELYMDFAVNRNDFRLAVFGDVSPLEYQKVNKYAESDKPAPANVFKFIMREFPGIISVK